MFWNIFWVCIPKCGLVWSTKGILDAYNFEMFVPYTLGQTKNVIKVQFISTKEKILSLLINRLSLGKIKWNVFVSVGLDNITNITGCVKGSKVTGSVEAYRTLKNHGIAA